MSAIVYADEMTQCSVHPPTAFMVMHRHALLPSWTSAIGSVVIVLQRCSVSLAHCTPQTRHCKNQLRDRFFRIGWQIAHHLDSSHDRCEIFDPRNGFPMRSPHGLLRLDDVAVASRCLGYAFRKQGTCATLIHPIWKDAVYPATLVATASPEIVAQQLTHQQISKHINSQFAHL